MKKIVLNDNSKDMSEENPGFFIHGDNEAEDLLPLDDDDTDDNDDFSSVLKELRKLAEMSSNDDDDDDEDDEEEIEECKKRERFELEKDAHDYHNDGVLHANVGDVNRAIEICIEGLRKFPYNMDLMADIVKYSTESGNRAFATDYYSKLKKIPYSRWNWRAFAFSADYLTDTDPDKNEKECRQIIKEFKKHLPYDERAYMAESNLEDALGNPDSSISILEQAIQEMPNCAQCALKLADKQIERSRYEECISTVNYGLAASVSTQATINEAYLVFIGTLVSDYLLHRKVCYGENVSFNDVEAVKSDYKQMLKDYPDALRRYKRRIEMRMKLLNYIKTSSYEEN